MKPVRIVDSNLKQREREAVQAIGLHLAEHCPELAVLVIRFARVKIDWAERQVVFLVNVLFVNALEHGTLGIGPEHLPWLHAAAGEALGPSWDVDFQMDPLGQEVPLALPPALRWAFDQDKRKFGAEGGRA